MLQQFTAWLLTIIKGLFSAVWTFVQDAFIAIAEMVTGVLATLLALIPVPPFMADGLQSLFNGLGGDVLWLCVQFGVPEALGIIGAGYAFRLTRKVVTLFQW